MTREEAIERIKYCIEKQAWALDENDTEALYEVIPELAESEDERIRKAIMEVLKRVSGATDVLENQGTTFKKAMIWLEKQKEYPTNEEMLRTLRVEYEKGVADTIAKYEQKEQKPVDFPTTDEEVNKFQETHSKVEVPEKYKTPDFVFSKQEYESHPIISKDTTSVKPAEWSEDWREEDVQTRFAFYTYKDDPSVLYLSNVFVEETSRNHGFGTRILRAAEKVAEAIGATTISLKVKQNSPANAWYRKNGYGYVAFEDGYDWLEKNLEYMKPNKQEWSEEDENMLNSCISSIEEAKENRYAYKETDGDTSYDHEIAWLKSLRPPQYCENCKLKRSVENWKPSKEQIGMLLAVINDPNNAGAESCHLMLQSLYADLEKLYL